MGRYAKNTTVSVEKTQADIQKVLKRYKATSFASGWCNEENKAYIEFVHNGTTVRVVMRIPEKEQEERQRWRALRLVIIAKLEAVDSGISTFEEEFLAWVVMANGKTVGENVMPRLLEAANQGKRLALLTA